jgi:hypothetical protein
MSVLSISGCAHVISIHAFHLELSCLCLSDISTLSSEMPVHNTEASDASSVSFISYTFMMMIYSGSSGENYVYLSELQSEQVFYKEI